MAKRFIYYPLFLLFPNHFYNVFVFVKFVNKQHLDRFSCSVLFCNEIDV